MSNTGRGLKYNIITDSNIPEIKFPGLITFFLLFKQDSNK